MYIEDVLIANMLANFCIAYFSISILRFRKSYPRILFSSFIGTVYAVMFPYVSSFVFLYKLICLLSCTLVSTKFASFKKYLLFLLTYALVSFVLGGGAYAIYLTIKSDISFEGAKIALILSIIIFYISLREIRRFALKRQISAPNGVIAEVSVGNMSYKVDCFNDTGNILVDNLTNKPVFIISSDIFPIAYSHNARTLRIHTITGEKNLPIIIVDKLTLYHGDSSRVYKKMPIAISDGVFENYKLIYNENAL